MDLPVYSESDVIVSVSLTINFRVHESLTFDYRYNFICGTMSRAIYNHYS